MLEAALASLSLLGIPSSTPIFLVQDFLRPGVSSESQRAAYQKYLEGLADLQERWPLLSVVPLGRWGHISGGLREVIGRITTEFVLVAQHDFEFVRAVDLPLLLEVMRANSELRHVRFNKNALTVVDWDAEYEYRNKIKSRRDFIHEFVYGHAGAEMRFVRTLAWSDNNYVCSTDYLRTVVLPLVGQNRVPPEHVLNPLGRVQNHSVLGTFIFDRVDAPPVIRHLDGRRFHNSELVVESARDSLGSHPLYKKLHDLWLRTSGRLRMSLYRRLRTPSPHYGAQGSMG